MSSTAADVHPALPPIKTTPPAPAAPAACSSAASSSTAPAPAPDAESVAMATLSSAAENQQQQEEEKGEAYSAEAKQEETEPTTPTSEGSKLRAPTVCPPAPRKPAWAPPSTPAKRKFQSSAAPTARRAFFPVARDLTTVFVALPPPKKRIRAG